jgi:hypothetical protein
VKSSDSAPAVLHCSVPLFSCWVVAVAPFSITSDLHNRLLIFITDIGRRGSSNKLLWCWVGCGSRGRI